MVQRDYPGFLVFPFSIIFSIYLSGHLDAEKCLGETQKDLDDLKKDVAAVIKKKLPVQKEEVQVAIGKWEADLAGLKDKLNTGNIREAFDGLKAMMEAVKAKKDDIAKLVQAPQRSSQ